MQFKASLRALLALGALAMSGGHGALAKGAGAPFDRLLEARTSEGEQLVAIPIAAGERWCVKWNHSVEHFTVLDCYRNVEGVMQLERSHQPDFAAGLGPMLGRGVQRSDGEGGYWIEEIDEPVPGNRYFLRVGAPGVDHRLVWQKVGEISEFNLSAYVPGQRVTLQLVAPTTASESP